MARPRSSGSSPLTFLAGTFGRGLLVLAPTVGTLYTVWQDGRFSNGARDGIAFSRSTDGGLTWSAPVRINGDPTVAAFTPAVAVAADGRVGVTYYDFRGNTSDLATLLTSAWITTCAPVSVASVAVAGMVVAAVMDLLLGHPARATKG